MFVGIGCGTSMAREPWPVRAMARKVGSSLVEPCMLPHYVGETNLDQHVLCPKV
jgi:hypothetical protein